MKISESNIYSAEVLAVHHGAVNDEVEVVLDGGNERLTSIITNKSVKLLGIAQGKKVTVLFTQASVILLADSGGIRFSARNQLAGTVTTIKEGVVNARVSVRLDCGESLAAMISIDSLKSLELEAGTRVTALVKASNVILGTHE